MTTVQDLQIRCGTCGFWMPATAPDPATDAATLLGTVVQCRKCLQRTTVGAENMRVREADGRFVHWPG